MSPVHPSDVDRLLAEAQGAVDREPFPVGARVRLKADPGVTATVGHTPTTAAVVAPEDYRYRSHGWYHLIRDDCVGGGGLIMRHPDGNPQSTWVANPDEIERLP